MSDNGDETDTERLRGEIVEGFDANEADLGAVLDALKQNSVDHLILLREAVTFLKQLAVTETPADPEAIKELEKKEIVFVTYRVNFFERLRLPVVTDDQLEHLLMRAHELWGEHPTEPVGRWVDWCLWTHLHRRRNGIPISEVIAGNRTAKDLKDTWIERYQAREDRRRLQKVDNYDRYDVPEDVPPSIRHMVMSPFIEEPEIADVEVDINAPASETEP